jgi:LPXTG-motif cell wall-anchored protein
MTRWMAPVAGVLMVLLGGLWTLQGVGVVGGSFMTGSRLWLVIGLIVLVAGVALLLRRRRRV